MKVTEYFAYRRQRPDRLGITDVCIDRGVLLADGETVHNAFFDRSFKGDHR